MRIIGGKYKRRLIKPPRNLPVRPTTDLAKESLFNIISNRIDLNESTALDLFAGTGSISYEFASRGCPEVTAVDQNFPCIGFIKETIANLGMESVRPFRAEVFGFIRKTKSKFDIIFADPPYDLKNLDQISIEIINHQLLKPGGLLIIEHPKGVDLSQQQYFDSHRRYGHVNFSFFEADL